MNLLKHEFVKLIPSKENLKDGVLYISLDYKTAIHKCVCGCGNEVITPISPTDWKLIFDGDSISLYPSIGNWNFECQSHYWIRSGKVIIATRLSSDDIEKGRRYDKIAKNNYFNKIIDSNSKFNSPSTNKNWWHELLNFLKGI